MPRLYTRLLIYYLILFIPRRKSIRRQLAEPITPEILLAMQYCKDMVLRIILQRAISFATHEAIGTALKTRGSDKRIDFLLSEQIENLNEEDTSGDRQGECQETADYDADRCQVQERL